MCFSNEKYDFQLIKLTNLISKKHIFPRILWCCHLLGFKNNLSKKSAFEIFEQWFLLLSICLFNCLSVRLSFSMSVCLSVYPPLICIICHYISKPITLSFSFSYFLPFSVFCFRFSYVSFFASLCLSNYCFFFFAFHNLNL
jgi:hypothetical protein